MMHKARQPRGRQYGVLVLLAGITFITTTLYTHISSSKYQKSVFENKYDNYKNPQYLQYIKDKYIYKQSTVLRNNSTLKSYQLNRDYSEYKQSTFVAKLLRNKENGFFLECGAAGGVKFSNSLYFELNLNWTGLLIEANSKFYKQLIASNRSAYMSNICLNTRNFSSKQTFVEHSWWGGIKNVLKSSGPKNISTRLVQCFPLYHVLLSLGVSRVDYFSLDVEGAEMDILKTIPFHQIYFDVIGIEYKLARYSEMIKKLASIRDFFNTVGHYKEVGLLPVQTNPINKADQKYMVERGVDVFFQRVD